MMKTTYAQSGEDIIIDNIFKHELHFEGPGFFVDVGAYHPTEYSNTMLLYHEGWHGINIDARPGLEKPFQQLRPRDINIQCAIANDQRKMTYHMLDEFPSANSLSNTFLKTTDETKNVTSSMEVITTTLAAVLDTHLPEGQNIDLLNIDVEGLDYEVLASNDWNRFRPRVVVIELMANDLFALVDDPSVKLLHELDYKSLGRSYIRNNVGSLFFIHIK
jgi:FkbM family methyltransferase